MVVLEELQLCEETMRGSEDVLGPVEVTGYAHGERKTTHHHPTSSIYTTKLVRSRSVPSARIT